MGLSVGNSKRITRTQLFYNTLRSSHLLVTLGVILFTFLFIIVIPVVLSAQASLSLKTSKLLTQIFVKHQYSKLHLYFEDWSHTSDSLREVPHTQLEKNALDIYEVMITQPGWGIYADNVPYLIIPKYIPIYRNQEVEHAVPIDSLHFSVPRRIHGSITLCELEEYESPLLKFDTNKINHELLSDYIIPTQYQVGYSYESAPIIYSIGINDNMDKAYVRYYSNSEYGTAILSKSTGNYWHITNIVNQSVE